MMPDNLHFVLDKDWNNAVAKRIRDTRKTRGLTQKQAAEALGISYQNFGHYEKGARKLPLNLVPQIAEVLETSVEELLGLEQKTKRRGPLSQIERRLEKIRAMPKKEQENLLRTIDTLIAGTELKAS